MSSPGADDVSSEVPQTPNGETDLLSSENALHIVATPQSAVSQFSIDSPNENDSNHGPEIYEDDENNTQDPSDSEFEDDDVNGGLGEDASFGLAQRTNQIMSSYRDYISEIQNDPIEGTLMNREVECFGFYVMCTILMYSWCM